MKKPKDTAFENLNKKYDLELAITARRVLMIEAHTNQDCADLVWQPTQQLLDEIADKPQEFLVCIHTPIYPGKDKKSFFTEVDIVSPDKKIAYLGTALNYRRAVSDWQMLLQRLCRFPDRLEEIKALIERGPMAIIRQHLRCGIPTDADRLDQEAIEEAIRYYMRTFCRRLANLPIAWLNRNEQETLEILIWQEARKKATPQTQERKVGNFESDF